MARWLWLFGVVVVVACSGDATPSTTNASPSTTPAPAPSSAPETTLTTVEPELPVDESFDVLPEREGPRRETTGGVPHVQLNAPSFPDIDAELRRRAFSLPGVDEAPSAVSLPGAVGLVLADDVEAERADVLLAAREFAHFHPDGSLHIWLPLERAAEVEAQKWGEFHPWVDREMMWDGMMMLFVPESDYEAAVLLRIIVDSYNFITGQDLDPADYP